MESIGFILDIALILLSTKVFGLISKSFKLPQVVGAILGGLLLGPAVFGVITETEFIHDLSKLGVIILMFGAGLNTNIKQFKEAGKASFFIALAGVLIPLAGGYLIASIFNKPGVIDSGIVDQSLFLQNMFIGVILTATSVSITVEALKEMGKLSSQVGNTILGAAIIDDVMGIVALTVVTSFATKGVNIWMVLFKILAFFVVAFVISIIVFKLFNKWQDSYLSDRRRFVIASFVFCLLLAYCGERFFGVADITGAFVAGLAISSTPRQDYISQRFDTLSYILLSPLFFASIGLKVSLPSMTPMVLAFSACLLIMAIITKIVGCGLCARSLGHTNRESLQIGVGMMTRGEVALIIANKGAAMGLMSEVFFGPIVVVVICTAILTPIFLKIVFKDKKTVSKAPKVVNA